MRGVAFLLLLLAMGPAWALDGPVKGLHPKLVGRLKKMERAFGRPVHITPHGGCRKHGSRAAPRSYHRIAAGCRAADVWIAGVAGPRILRYWRRHGGGGTGYYCGRRFVHVDVGPDRHWAWFCGSRR